ncbi:MAG TPA: DUF5615 family PIN-like protein [Acetobacteraceae bacterium]
MRFLADENFPGAAVTALRVAVYDVVRVRPAAPGSSDPDVLAWAQRESRVLLTFDKDFGELARGSAADATYGIICSVPRCRDQVTLGTRLADLITQRNDWSGHFSAVEIGRIHMRRLRSVRS